MSIQAPLRSLSAAALLACACAATHAADTGKLQTSFSGFGTIATTTTDSASYQYKTSATQFKGASNRMDIGLNSVLGLQGIVRFDDKFTVTAQALAKRVGNKDFDIGAEWLFGQYHAAEGVDLRLGRVVLPAFSLSDSRNVTYSQPWLRSPTELYSSHPFSTLDGVQALWTRSFGGVVLSTQASYGSVEAIVSAPGFGELTVQGKDVVNLNATVEVNAWSLRLAQTRLTTPFTLPLNQSTVVNYNIQDRFTQLGLQYDDGRAIVISEWVKRTENSAPGLGRPFIAATAWYAAAGWRFGDITPMVRYVRFRDDGSLSRLGTTSSVGTSVRFELARNVAAKLQWDRYDATTSTVFIVPATSTGTKVNVFGAGLDFVF